MRRSRIAAVPYEGSPDYAEVPAASQAVAIREAGAANILGSLDATLVAGEGDALVAGGSAIRTAPGTCGR